MKPVPGKPVPGRKLRRPPPMPPSNTTVCNLNESSIAVPTKKARIEFTTGVAMNEEDPMESYVVELFKGNQESPPESSSSSDEDETKIEDTTDGNRNKSSLAVSTKNARVDVTRSLDMNEESPPKSYGSLSWSTSDEEETKKIENKTDDPLNKSSSFAVSTETKIVRDLQNLRVVLNEESPTKLYPPLKNKIETNIDLATVPLLEEDDDALHGDKFTKSELQKGENNNFVLPAPLNEKEESESDLESDSDQFFAGIKAREELQLKKTLNEDKELVILNPEISAEVFRALPRQMPFFTVVSDGTVIAEEDTKQSSTSMAIPAPDSDYLTSSMSGTSPVEFTMKLYCVNTSSLMYDSKEVRLRSDFGSIVSLLKQCGVDLNNVASSGYSADVSSMSVSESPRITVGSTMSSIPRPSGASTLDRPSLNSNNPDRLPFKEALRLKPRSGKEPIYNSTVIEDYPIRKKKISKKKLIEAVEANDADMEASRDYNVFSNGDVMQDSSGQLGKPSSSQDSSGKPSSQDSSDKPSFDVINDTDSSQSAQSSGISLAKKKTPVARKYERMRTPKLKPGAQQEDYQSNTGPPMDEAARKAIAEFNDDSFSKSATLWGTIGTDELAFARWRDKSYYSGLITAKGTFPDTWDIKYDDGMDDVASELHILPIKIIGVGTGGIYCPEGVYKPEDVYVVGSRYCEGDQSPKSIEYAVVSKNGKVIVCLRKNLSLREKDAKELRKCYQQPVTVVKDAGVMFENILNGTRRRVGDKLLYPSDKIRKLIKLEHGGLDASTSDEKLLLNYTPTPKKAVGKTALISRTRKLSDSSTSGHSDNGSESDECKPIQHITPDPGLPPKLISKETPKISHKDTTQIAAKETSKVSGKETPKYSGKEVSKISNKESPKMLGKETPKRNKEGMKKVKGKDKPLFDGMQFFVTASSTNNTGDPLESMEMFSYDKDDYRDSIEEYGGRVIDVVGEEVKGETGKIFLISDTYARTVKYIYCLAAVIPCVSFKWISVCLKEKEIVDWKRYQLESGYSLEEERVIPAHIRLPLKDMKIAVTAESGDLYKYWKPILTAGEATLLKSDDEIIPAEAEVLVTDETVPVHKYRHAIEQNIPIVKPEWLVQTIILGKKADFDGYDKYKLELTEQLEPELSEVEDEDVD